MTRNNLYIISISLVHIYCSLFDLNLLLTLFETHECTYLGVQGWKSILRQVYSSMSCVAETKSERNSKVVSTFFFMLLMCHFLNQIYKKETQAPDNGEQYGFLSVSKTAKNNCKSKAFKENLFKFNSYNLFYLGFTALQHKMLFSASVWEMMGCSQCG